MRASVIRVTGRSLLAGRKLRTPEIKFSRPPSLKRSVICTMHQHAATLGRQTRPTLLPNTLKPLNSSPPWPVPPMVGVAEPPRELDRVIFEISLVRRT